MENSYIFCCICIDKNSNLVCVTEFDENGVKYSEKLASCDPNQNWNDKTLGLCVSCLQKLNIVYEFIGICKRSEALRAEKLLKLEKELQEREADSEVFTCYVCKKSFSRKRFLKSHITRIHTGAKQRNIVDENNKIAEKENEKISDPNITIKAKLEDSIDELKIEFYNEQYEYFPQEVDSTYSSEEEEKSKPQKERRKVILKKPDKKPESLTCEYCGKQFKRQQHWSSHIRSKHTFEKPYKCKICDASFATSHSLLVHKRNHNNEKPYVCSTCGKKFVCSGDLFHHNKIHLNKKEYECNICNKRFNTTSILRTHKIVKHAQPEDWKYTCMVCERKFPINSSLTLHMKRHTGIKDHACHICGKKFYNKSEVMKHVLCHSNQKRFKCHLCEDKEYKNKEGLNKHLKIIHNEGTWKAPKLENKFVCSMCPKKFPFNNRLQRHLLTHTGEKPYKCNYCDKRFADVYYRKSHMKKEHFEQFEDYSKEIKFERPMEISANGFT